MSVTELFLMYSIAGIVICSVWAIIYPHLPRVRLFTLELFPSIRIHLKAKTLHVHHWFYYPIILVVSLLIDGGFLASIPVRGYLVGAIVKEVFFPPKKNIVPRKMFYKSSEEKA